MKPRLPHGCLGGKGAPQARGLARRFLFNRKRSDACFILSHAAPQAQGPPPSSVVERGCLHPRPVCCSAFPAAPRHGGHPADTQASCAGYGGSHPRGPPAPGCRAVREQGGSSGPDVGWPLRDIPSPPTALKHRHFSDVGTDARHLQSHARGAAGPSLRPGGAESQPGTQGAPGGLLETPPPQCASSLAPRCPPGAEAQPHPRH